MTSTEAQKLLVKYVEGTATGEEQRLIEHYFQLYLNAQKVLPDSDRLQKDHKEIWEVLTKHIGATETKSRKLKLWPRIVAAASVVLAIGVGVWLYQHQSSIDGSDTGLFTGADVSPGSNGARLTLANGKTVELNGSKNGVIINASTFTYEDGSEVLEDVGLGNGTGSQQISASTPRGNTYSFTLADGTKVWLNADSKLDFPSNFDGSSQRIVKLSGEAYLEVAKDRRHPFIVETDGQRVEVLGTHFNVNSYVDEGNVKTTLLEGSVAVHLGFARHLDDRRDLSSDAKDPSSQRAVEIADKDVILKPGQQSVVDIGESNGTSAIRVRTVDIDEVMAWQKGLFMFESEQLESIMRRVARWYNVDVIYEDATVGKQVFSGSVSRFANVSSLLRKLEKTGPVKFRIEKRKVYVSKK